jgi:hypothetical protein
MTESLVGSKPTPLPGNSLSDITPHLEIRLVPVAKDLALMVMSLLFLSSFSDAEHHVFQIIWTKITIFFLAVNITMLLVFRKVIINVENHVKRVTAHHVNKVIVYETPDKKPPPSLTIFHQSSRLSAFSDLHRVDTNSSIFGLFLAVSSSLQVSSSHFGSLS